jgi:hypothetical protein
MRIYALAIMTVAYLGSGVPAHAQNPHSFFAEHNGSVMRVDVGAVSEDAASLKIYYAQPSSRMRNAGVTAGTLLFDGTVVLDEDYIGGNARIFKFGCRPLTYEVRGSFGTTGPEGEFVLLGPAPVFARTGCNVDHLSTGPNSRLVFRSLN